MQEVAVQPVTAALFRKGETGNPEAALLPGEDKKAWSERIAATLGTRSIEATMPLISAIAKCADKVGSVEFVNGALATLQEMDLHDPVQRMLAVECVLASHASMDAMAKLRSARFSEEQVHFSSVALKMGTLASKLADTLRKLKSNGEQRITVVHVGDTVNNTLVQGGALANCAN